MTQHLAVWLAFGGGLVLGLLVGRFWSSESWVDSKERKQMMIENDRR